MWMSAADPGWHASEEHPPMHVLNNAPVVAPSPAFSPYGFGDWPSASHWSYGNPHSVPEYRVVAHRHALPILQQPTLQPPTLQSPSPGAWLHRQHGSPGVNHRHQSIYRHQFQDGQRNLPTATSNVALGPPRKPKRSGHALWVGNLHPATTIGQLKDHFSNGFTDDIESVFLISRSTCAFINYRSENACRLALARFHSTRLNGHNLVCRARRDMEPNTGTKKQSASQTDDRSSETVESPTSPVIVGTLLDASSTPPKSLEPAAAKVPVRYFILKSLTVQDLEESVRSSSWVTQQHNEQALCDAFQGTEIVYLIFSANKSREYFGFARMTSSPSLGQRAKFTVDRSATEPVKYAWTAATSSAPRGRIVDDSGRGTLFWEAWPSEGVIGDSPEEEEPNDEGRMGRRFDVEWISLNKTAFIHTRGLRNPWNANREIKVARDGTEIEPSVGRRLLDLFGRSSNHTIMPQYDDLAP